MLPPSTHLSRRIVHYIRGSHCTRPSARYERGRQGLHDLSASWPNPRCNAVDSWVITRMGSSVVDAKQTFGAYPTCPQRRACLHAAVSFGFIVCVSVSKHPWLKAPDACLNSSTVQSWRLATGAWRQQRHGGFGEAGSAFFAPSMSLATTTQTATEPKMQRPERNNAPPPAAARDGCFVLHRTVLWPSCGGCTLRYVHSIVQYCGVRLVSSWPNCLTR
jgi:hypothetical protein